MSYTLLLADDSATIQRVIQLMFADEDVRVVAVSDGDQAIVRLDQQPPDIVLADVGMPGRNGYEVASYVKSQPRLAHIPVLLLTGAFEPIDQAKADLAGCHGVLIKPFEPQVVIRLVKALLAGSPAVSTPDALPPATAGEVAVVRIPELPAVARPAEGESAATARPQVDDDFADLDAALAKVPVGRADAAAPPPQRLSTPLALATTPRGSSPTREEAASTPAAAAAPLIITDELIDRVARRVLDTLSERVVRETVAEVVAVIAERLIRDEIERIKGAIR